MKKIGTLNARLSSVIAAMGHTDRLVICDSGLPIPRDAVVVDLALTRNIPRFMDVLTVVLEELEVESAIVATELRNGNDNLHESVSSALGDVELSNVPHEQFKEETRADGRTAFVRTGEATPYANVILCSGVTFS